MNFEAFPKIKQLKHLKMSITQKIHGTNAHIYVASIEIPFGTDNEVLYDGKCFQVKAASRNRWIYPDDDNYGFAKWVQDNKEDIVRLLGPGRHDGEWAGSGINSGEGFEKDEKVFVLFDWWRYPPERELPKGCVVVPVLYDGPVDLSMVDKCMSYLLASGSRLKPGFNRPEGVVVMINGTRFKKTFTPEESTWSRGGDPNKVKVKKEVADYSHLCQPMRLEKLLSRDERYVRDYPKSLPLIVKVYVQDLIEEGQIKGDEDKIKAIKKGASNQIFKFIRSFIDEGEVA